MQFFNLGGKMIKGLIFDMDGVIVDSEYIFEQVEKEMFDYYGIPYDSKEMMGFVGRTVVDFWAYFLGKYPCAGLTLDDAIEEHTKRYLEAIQKEDNFVTIAGVKELMTVCHRADIRMVVASSSKKIIVKTIIDRFGLDEYVMGYVAGDMVEKGKPNPEIFLKASQLIGVEPEACVVIEDSQNGIKAAKAAGMYAVGFNQDDLSSQDLSEADLIINKMDELRLF